MCQKNFSVVKNNIFLFILTVCFMAYLPRYNMQATQTAKYMYTAVSIFIYVALIMHSFGLSQLHQVTVMTITVVFLIHDVKLWYNIGLAPVCIWDGYIHVFLPVLLMTGNGVINTQRRLQEEEKIKIELQDMKSVLGRLNSGVAIATDWYSHT